MVFLSNDNSGEQNSGLLARRAALVRLLALAAMAIIATSQLLYAIGPRSGPWRLEVAPGYVGLPVTAQAALRILAVSGWLGSFWFLNVALRPLGRGRAFSETLTLNLRRFATLLVAAIAVPTLLAPLIGIGFALYAPTPGAPYAVRIEIRECLFLAVAAIFFLVARLLDEARRLEEDNAQIV